MTDEEIINQIIFSFSKYNLRDITEINQQDLDFTIAEFILCSCFIDQISGFRYNLKDVGKRYSKFVKEYLHDYDADELYVDLRCKLVHNYSVGNYYGLTRNAPNLHLQIHDGKKYLNLENLISDLRQALDIYILELQNDIEVRKKALAWYSNYKILCQL